MRTATETIMAFCLVLGWTHRGLAQAPESEAAHPPASEEIAEEAAKSDAIAEPAAVVEPDSEENKEVGAQDVPAAGEPGTAPMEPVEAEGAEGVEREDEPATSPESVPSVEPAPVPAVERELEPKPALPEGKEEPQEKPIQLEKPFARQGEFIALGTHFDMATAHDKGRGWRKISIGPAFNLRLGEAIVDWADIGLEFGLALPGGDEKLTSGRIIAHTRLYPHERLFIHTGFGFGFAGGPDTEDAAFQRGRYGDVYVLGLGTNLYLGNRNRSGGPMFSPVASFELGPDKEFTTAVFWIGGEFSWWAGLPRDKLDLPIGEAYQRGAHRK